jgi:polysaccharide biosynthesis protein PslH
MPFNAKDGGALAVKRSLETILNTGAEVHMVAVNSTKQWIKPVQFEKEIIDTLNFQFVQVNTRLNALSVFFNLLGGHDYFTRRFYSKQMELKIKALISKTQFDVVLLEHLSMAHYLPVISKNGAVPVILKMHNVESNLVEQRIKRSRGLFKRAYLKLQLNRLKNFEKEACAAVDGLVAFTKEDAKHFQEINQNTNISIQPLPIHGELTRPTPMVHDAKKSFYHIGSMDWWPNQEGMAWFLKKVWPLLKDKIESSFHFAGKQMPQEFNSYNNHKTFCDGEVECATDYHLRHGIMVVPLLSGSGIRMKILEAMSIGKCIISTSLGAQGIGCTHRHNILIADTVEEFSELIRLCDKEPEYAKRIGCEAKKFAYNYFSIIEASQKCNDFLVHCIETKKAPYS